MKRAPALAAARGLLDPQRQAAGGVFRFGLQRGSSQGHNPITSSLGLGRALCSHNPAMLPNPSLNRTHNGMPPTGLISFLPFGVLPSRAG